MALNLGNKIEEGFRIYEDFVVKKVGYFVQDNGVRGVELEIALTSNRNMFPIIPGHECGFSVKIAVDEQTTREGFWIDPEELILGKVGKDYLQEMCQKSIYRVFYLLVAHGYFADFSKNKKKT